MAGIFMLWSHLLAAALYGALAIWQLRRWNGDPRNRPLVTAFAVVSVWAIFMAMLGPYTFLSHFAESGRNLAFLAFMYGIMQSAGEDSRQRGVKAVYAAVAAVIGLQIVIGGLLPEFESAPQVFEALTSTSQIMGLTVAAGSLVLVHNLYGQAAPDSRLSIKLPALALAAMWAYDLHLYTVVYFTRTAEQDLFAMRGAVLAMLVPLFALGIRRTAEWKVKLSRAATFQSLSVLAILGYLLVMMSATRALEIVGGDWIRLGQVGIIFLMTIAAFILLPSGKARAWLHVVTAKHLFEHRYDYRQEWLRFTQTVGLQGEGQAPIEERVIQALADIGGAPAGLLLVADHRQRLGPAAGWNWGGSLPDASEDDGAFGRFLAETAFVVDFDRIVLGRLDYCGKDVAVPAWISRIESAWAGIPLIHAGKLVGLVVLQHPLVRRSLDWEDFDLFRAAGTQAASYIAEARTQQALADAQRFDEFNRRFAFIMHDIKNLVSQLSLVSRNAERHADNPEFRADMVATLQSSVRKMNDLLARLSRGNAREAEPPRPMPVQRIAEAVAEPKRRLHPIEIGGDARLAVLADPSRLEQALGHLVQNAIDASRPDDPVQIRFAAKADEIAIEVIDAGRGMSGEFMRTRLFQPFASTKDSGFGIGAYEARTLVEAMGGRLEVESREGEGSRFTIFLPKAESVPSIERMPA